MKYTAGPWVMSGQLVVGPPQPCPNPKAQPNSPVIASVAWDFDGDRNATGELPWSIAKHNGKLICAAPVMADVIRQLDRVDRGGTVPWVHNAGLTNNIEALRAICLAYCSVWNNSVVPLLKQLETP